MSARNCNAVSVGALQKKDSAKAKSVGRARILAMTLAAMAFFAGVARARGQEAAATASEVRELRQEVGELRASVKRLEALLRERAGSTAETATPATVEAAITVEPGATPSTQALPVKSTAEAGIDQYTGRTNDASIAMATKEHGGDLSGAGNLLRTERVAVGGYGDFQFRMPALNERADGGGSDTFQSTRFVLGIAAVLSQKQNITLNSEIEYELGAHEIDIEQAFLSWRVKPEFDFRAGIIVPPIGRFNTFHDSNLNILTLRPLINQYIVPTAYRDAGIGVRGAFRLPHEMKMSYEADVVNGFQARNADGEATPFSRIYGQSSAAEPVSIAFQATRNNKAVAGRIGFSPVLGLEFGVSTYAGTFTAQDDPKKSATIVFLDASYQRGPFVLNGEYGRSNIVGSGIARKSAPPPAFDPNDPLSVAALGNYVAQTSPGQDGFYVESGYKFFRGIFKNREKFDEGAYLMPVVRFEAVRRDRTLSN
ncbi:MAG: hypothetical protein NVS9B14_18440 [Candidatus Acidiferrum sp.]